MAGHGVRGLPCRFLQGRPAGASYHGGCTITAIDLARFDVLTFDTYGTLIDWERGLLNALQPVLAAHDVSVGEEALLELFARHESELQAGVYLTYREVLALACRRLCGDLSVVPDDAAVIEFAASVPFWPAFPDSAAALRRLATRYRLGVLTNCDDDLYAGSMRRLGVRFDPLVTAQQARGYKPRRANFELLLDRVGVPPERVLHVAQSLFHDHVPAKAMGLTTVWIDRRGDKAGFGATPRAEATPDLVVPSLAALADLAGV